MKKVNEISFHMIPIVDCHVSYKLINFRLAVIVESSSKPIVVQSTAYILKTDDFQSTFDAYIDLLKEKVKEITND